MNTLEVELLVPPDMRRPQKHLAEQFELFPADPARRHKAWIVAGDETDPTQTLVVDGTRDADGGGARKP